MSSRIWLAQSMSMRSWAVSRRYVCSSRRLAQSEALRFSKLCLPRPPATNVQTLPTCSEHPVGGMIRIMSIYATLWKLKFPKDGDDFTGCDWIEVTAQGVPAHIGSPSPGAGYASGDPFGAFLPPPVAVDSEGDAPHLRAVVFITELTQKGTERSGQEYQSPLLVLTGEEYDKITFADLYERICSVLRGNRAPVIAQIILPDGSNEIIRHRPRPAE